MATKQSIHTFEGGMVLDVDKSRVKANTYINAYNFRFLSDEDGNTGILYTPNASSILVNTSDYPTVGGYIPTEIEIAGHKVIRNYLILFLRGRIPTSGAVQFVLRYTISNGILGSSTLLWAGEYQANTDWKLFSSDEFLSCVGRYEASDLIKVYWAAKDHPIRSANITKYWTEDGTSSTDYLDINRFNLITNIDVFNICDVTDVLENGNLTTGRVQYACNLYKINNQESVISSLTSPINLFYDNFKTSDSCETKGDFEEIDTNKSIKVEFNLSTEDSEYYDKLRLYRIHYKSYGQLPEITILTDIDINQESFEYVDLGGTGLGNYSAEEFSTISGIQYYAYSIEEKDNRLFAANLTEDYFDVDFDARAYRFKVPYVSNGITGTVTSTSSLGTFDVRFIRHLREEVSTITLGSSNVTLNGDFTITGYPYPNSANIYSTSYNYKFQISYTTWSGYFGYSIGDVVLYSGVLYRAKYNILLVTPPDPPNSNPSVDTTNWETLSSALVGETVYTVTSDDPVCHIYDNSNSYSGELSVTTSNWNNISTTHNCINKFNDYSKDSNDAYYMYQSDGVTIGGEGPNVKYNFFSKSDLILDYNLNTDGNNARNFRSFGNNEFNNVSDYSNPLVCKEYTGYQRDEIYRFGIVFIDKKGRRSTVKWIGDIRFPTSATTGYIDNYGSLNLHNHITYSSGDNNTYINALGINVTLKNGLPNNAVSWELVRVPRKRSDKSIITSGIFALTTNYDTSGDNITQKSKNLISSFTSFSSPLGSNHTYNRYVTNFISPEHTYNKKTEIKEDDFIEICYSAHSDLSNYKIQSSSSGYHIIKYFKYDDIYRHEYSGDFGESPVNNCKYEITESKYVYPLNYNYTDGVNKYVRIKNAVNSDFNMFYSDDFSDGSNTHYGVCGRCDLISLSSPVSSSLGYSGSSSNELFYARVKRNNLSRYNGDSYQSRLNNNYISCGNPQTSTSFTFWGGDTYINMFNYVNVLRNDDSDVSSGTPTTISTYFNNIIFPVESTINLSLNHGLNIANTPGFGATINLPFFDKELGYLAPYREEAGVYGEFEQRKDIYLYNTIYSQESNIKYDFPDVNDDINTEHDVLVAYSDFKLNDELTDSWTKFRVNNNTEVSGQYGPIRKLVKHNNEIYFVQEKAIGILPINQRALTNDNNVGTLLLGTGDVLPRHDYINVYYGALDKKSVDSAPSGIYIIDKKRQALVRLNSNGVKRLCSDKGVSSYFKSNDSKTVPLIAYNNNDSEVYVNYKDGETLLFNDKTDNFISFYDVNPEYISNAENFIFYKLKNDDRIYGLYLEEDEYGKFKNNTYVDSSIKIIDNSEFEKTKVYDNVKYHSNSYYKDLSGNIVDFRNNDNSTFSKVLFTNDYQSTGTTSIRITNGLQKRERDFTLAIPRNIVSSNEKTNLSPYNSSNYYSSRQFKERMRDKYITSVFTYENDSSNKNKRFEVPYISFLYRTSNR